MVDFNEKVLRARLGDDNAFAELIGERKEMLYRTAFTYVKNKDDALDIVGETIYKAYISIKKLKEPQFFNTWLTRILINISLDHIKKNKKLLPFEGEMAMNESVSSRDPAELLDLYYAVDRLEPKCKTIVILKYFQDFTLAQIAEVMECPIGTVKTYSMKDLKYAPHTLKLNVSRVSKGILKPISVEAKRASLRAFTF